MTLGKGSLQGKNSTFIALWIHDSSLTELYDQDNQEINQKRKGEKLC
jgi:hypothetical protein